MKSILFGSIVDVWMSASIPVLKLAKLATATNSAPTAYMEMNPDAAAALGVEHMSYLRLVSRRGDAVVLAQLSQCIPYKHGVHFIIMIV